MQIGFAKANHNQFKKINISNSKPKPNRMSPITILLIICLIVILPLGYLLSKLIIMMKIKKNNENKTDEEIS